MSTLPAKVALITGAARGIGLAATKKFLAEGWHVALLDIDGDNLARAMASLAQPQATLALTCDVAVPAQVDAALAAVKSAWGRLDALVNNAGIAVFKPAHETSHAEWQRVMDVNCTGPFLTTSAAVPLMRANGGGAVVNITSISGLRASTLRVAYGTSKAALAHLTKQFAAELALFNIRVNAVAPGPVDTAMAKAVHTPDIRADYHDAIPLNRYGLEEELAEAIYFLC
ncbi:MAG: SDR family NAD(P)-dependent oxidoreductase, partial [Beijerinckiaceae bacterium]